jgi:hypothetical protein
MDRKKGAWPKRAFVVAFIVLTSLCWCPWAYGTVTGRVLYIPSWAVLAYVFAAALFILEWVFLFHTRLAVSDEELASTISELEAAKTDEAATGQEDE